MLTAEQIERAIYIDFEATPEHRPSVLGVLYRKECGGNNTFIQYVLEKHLYPAKDECRVATINEAVEEVFSIARTENRVIFAWSSKEEQDIQNFCDPLISAKTQLFLINAIPIAKAWHKIHYPGIRIPKTPFRGRNTQEYYMNLIGFRVPRIYGPGNASQSIKAMRKALTLRKGNYDSIDPSVKSDWKCMLKHNKYDCRGMKKILEKIKKDTYEKMAA